MDSLPELRQVASRGFRRSPLTYLSSGGAERPIDGPHGLGTFSALRPSQNSR